jgi:hypothetical protein
MNEVIATILAGLPYTLILVGVIGGLIVHAWAFMWAADNDHDITAWILIAAPIVFGCIVLSYFFGSIW